VNAAIRTVADERQTEGGLPQPTFGDRQVEQGLVIGRGGRRKGILQSGLRRGGLLVNELAADLERVGQAGD
jgi:hypothetical protein